MSGYTLRQKEHEAPCTEGQAQSPVLCTGLAGKPSFAGSVNAGYRMAARDPGDTPGLR